MPRWIQKVRERKNQEQTESNSMVPYSPSRSQAPCTDVHAGRPRPDLQTCCCPPAVCRLQHETNHSLLSRTLSTMGAARVAVLRRAGTRILGPDAPEWHSAAVLPAWCVPALLQLQFHISNEYAWLFVVGLSQFHIYGCNASSSTASTSWGPLAHHRK